MVPETKMAFRLPEDCDHRVRAIYDYWRSIRPADRLPGRGDMDPVDIPDLLPDLWMADVERDPFRFRFRLMGSAIVHGMGQDLTGLYFDECFDGFDGSAPQASLIGVCTSREPTWRHGPTLLTRKNFNVKRMERIVLPLAADGETVDLLLALSAYVLIDSRGLARRS